MKRMFREYFATADETFHGVWSHAFSAIGETIQASLCVILLALWLVFMPPLITLAYCSRRLRGV